MKKPGRGIRQAHQKAREVLVRVSVLKPPVPVEEIVRAYGLTIRFEPTAGEISGALYVEGPRAVIGVNALHHANRQRFTIAHELGHYLLHAPAPSPERLFAKVDRHVLSAVWNRDAKSSAATDLEEIQANQFAAELLVPLEMLRRDVQSSRYNLEDDDDLRKLANRYRVSLQVLNYRLGELGMRAGNA